MGCMKYRTPADREVMEYWFGGGIGVVRTMEIPGYEARFPTDFGSFPPRKSEEKIAISKGYEPLANLVLR